MTRPPRELLEFLSRYDPEIQSLALGLRRVIHEELAPCHEYIFEMRSKVVLLYGATQRVIANGICSVNVFARHVNLGFPRGTDLDDPAGVLHGTGKAMRHVTLEKRADLGRPELRAYLRQARSRAGLKRQRHGTAAEVVTRVKQRSPTSQAPW